MIGMVPLLAHLLLFVIVMCSQPRNKNNELYDGDQKNNEEEEEENLFLTTFRAPCSAGLVVRPR